MCTVQQLAASTTRCSSARGWAARVCSSAALHAHTLAFFLFLCVPMHAWIAPERHGTHVRTAGATPYFDICGIYMFFFKKSLENTIFRCLCTGGQISGSFVTRGICSFSYYFFLDQASFKSKKKLDFNTIAILFLF